MIDFPYPFARVVRIPMPAATFSNWLDCTSGHYKKIRDYEPVQKVVLVKSIEPPESPTINVFCYIFFANQADLTMYMKIKDEEQLGADYQACVDPLMLPENPVAMNIDYSQQF